MLAQVEVRPVGDALEFAPAPREEVLDVGGRLGVVREFVGLVGAEAEVLLADAERLVPGEALLDPVGVPALVVAGLDEELHLHLLELAGAEYEVAGSDLVAERLADLRDAEGEFGARRGEHVVEVDEDALRGFGAQPHLARGVFDRARERLEHQVEHARGRQRGAVVRALRRVVEVVGAVALAAGRALGERVREVVGVPAGDPHLRVLDDGAVEADDVVALVDHRAPPGLLDVALEFDAERAVVPTGADAAVDFAGGEDEASPLGEGDDAREVGGGHRVRSFAPRGWPPRKRCAPQYSGRRSAPHRGIEAAAPLRLRRQAAGPPPVSGITPTA